VSSYQPPINSPNEPPLHLAALIGTTTYFERVTDDDGHEILADLDTPSVDGANSSVVSDSHPYHDSGAANNGTD
jgi:hypothetical protein